MVNYRSSRVAALVALLGGGGLWFAVREIARQVGETTRTRIRDGGETRRLTIMNVMPLRPATGGAAYTGREVPQIAWRPGLKG
jgi:hypothetical protein